MIDFKETIESMKDLGFAPIPDLVYVSIPDARNVLSRGLKYFTGDLMQWLPEYDKVAEWLTNNNGRGLLCCGNCGRGKTLICGRIIPVLLSYYCRKLISCYDAQQMNKELDAVKKRHIIYIDDVGTEFIKNDYGEKRIAFPELVDEAEKRGKLLIITTNLSLSELKEKYGERTIDRLKAVTTPVVFKGASLRK